MIVEEISLTKAKERFDAMLNDKFEFVYSNNADLRFLANEMNNAFKNEAKDKSPYQQDLIYGKRLYKVLSTCEWLDWAVATNRGFWRYLALYTMPQVTYDRFGPKDGEPLKASALAGHFYAKYERIYPYTLFWIYKICDQGSAEATFEFLSKPCFSTDTILNVVERMGPKGFRLDVYQQIIKKFSELDHAKYLKTIGSPNMILRALLVEHGIKNSVYIPELFKGGIEEYVEKVFRSTLGENYV